MLKPSSAVIGRSEVIDRLALTPSNSPKVLRTLSTTWDTWAPSHPPPSSALAHQSGTSTGVGHERHEHEERRDAGLADRTIGDQAVGERLRGSEPELGAEEVTTPAASAASSIACASPTSRANGFSHTTCLPAATASSTRS